MQHTCKREEKKGRRDSGPARDQPNRGSDKKVPSADHIRFILNLFRSLLSFLFSLVGFLSIRQLPRACTGIWDETTGSRCIRIQCQDLVGIHEGNT
ncbi:hypothetical protein KQX54_016132 [Cotesia glomerata]|uniref:Uncharacterized protein n=1 Tax=Cotesia glomerata TaxID=32391 RepID=A0AAV7HY11_COTGL|nr:hypothetical protein KQX54_016132 [Cotesia glomerata]